MFIDIARSRHSCREFEDSPVTERERGLILEAGGLAPSAKNRRPVRLIPVDDPETIRALAGCKDSGTKALDSAVLAIVVAADSAAADTWVEDLNGDSLGVISTKAESTLGLGLNLDAGTVSSMRQSAL